MWTEKLTQISHSKAIIQNERRASFRYTSFQIHTNTRTKKITSDRKRYSALSSVAFCLHFFHLIYHTQSQNQRSREKSPLRILRFSSRLCSSMTDAHNTAAWIDIKKAITMAERRNVTFKYAFCMRERMNLCVFVSVSVCARIRIHQITEILKIVVEP